MRIPWFLAIVLLWCSLSVNAAQPLDGPPSEDTPIWQKIRTHLFQDRPIARDDGQVIAFEVPTRAQDAAIVPIAIRARFPQSPDRFIDKV